MMFFKSKNVVEEKTKTVKVTNDEIIVLLDDKISSIISLHPELEDYINKISVYVNENVDKEGMVYSYTQNDGYDEYIGKYIDNKLFDIRIFFDDNKEITTLEATYLTAENSSESLDMENIQSKDVSLGFIKHNYNCFNSTSETSYFIEESDKGLKI